MYLKADLAFLYFIRQQYQKASEIFSQICFQYGEKGWNQIDSVLIERYAICQRQLKKEEDLIQCYLHLVCFPEYLALEKHDFYLEQLKKCCFQSPSNFKTINCSVFSITNLAIIDQLGSGQRIISTVHLNNHMPTDFEFESLSLLMEGGEGMSMHFEQTNVNIKPGHSTATLSGHRARIPGYYSPTVLIMTRGKLQFVYELPSNLQKACKIRIDETADSMVFSAKPSPSGGKSIVFEIDTKSNVFENGTLEISCLSSTLDIIDSRELFPVHLKDSDGKTDIVMCKFENNVICVPSISSRTFVRFELKYSFTDSIKTDHKVSILFRGLVFTLL